MSLFLVMRSLRMRKLKTRTITGVAVIIIEASIGDVKLIP